MAIDGRPWGTLGAIVHGPSGPCLLSNAHVLVPASAITGPDVPAVVVYDNHALTARRRLGELAAFVPMRAATQGVNRMDAAIATLDVPLSVDPTGLGPIGPSIPPRLGQRVFKVGAASQRRCVGRIAALSVDWEIHGGDYGLLSDGLRWTFTAQLLVEIDQIGGDSGSVLVDSLGRAVGLLHASAGPGRALATPARVVEDALNVRFGNRYSGHPTLS